MLVRLLAGPLLLVIFAFALVVAPRSGWARAPEPGDKVQITLHDGNKVVGELLGLSESGYRLSFGGMEVIVAYPSVAGIEVLVEDSLLEEMRPGSRPDLRGRSEPTYGDPEPRSQPQEPEYQAPPPEPEYRQPEYRRPEPAPPRQAAPPPRMRTPEPPRVQRRPPSRDNDRSQATDIRIPPKPRSRGGGLMVTGFVMLGVGTAIAVGSAVAYEDQARDGYYDWDLGLPALTVTGSIVATAGLVMGVTGSIIKAVSGGRRRRWERRYGDVGLVSPGQFAIVPSLNPQGGGGLAVVGSF